MPLCYTLDMSSAATSADIQKLESSVKNLERKVDDTLRDLGRIHGRLETLEKVVQQEDLQTDKIEQIVGNIRSELTQVEQRLKQHIELHSSKKYFQG